MTSARSRHKTSSPQLSFRKTTVTSPSVMTSSSRSSDQTDQDHLEGSFLLVPPDGDEDECSTVGSSLPDSVLFSDSDTHRDEGWESSNDGESVDGHLHDSPPASLTSRTNLIDSVLLASPSIDSYIDAEATNTFSDLNESRSTIHDAFESTSSSQIRLIMPDPASSFLTSSDGTTPSASFANIQTVPDLAGMKKDRRRGRVDQGWLEASSRLWSITPEVHNMLEEDQNPGSPDDYMLLASHDELKNATGGQGGFQTFEHQIITLDKPNGIGSALGEAPRPPTVAKTPVMRRILANRWSTRMSILTVASLLSIGLLRSFAPGSLFASLTANLEASSTSATSNIPSLVRTSSIWDRFSSVPSEIIATTAAAAPSSTQLIPDLLLIKQALSTFSYSHLKPTTEESEERIKQESVKPASDLKRKRSASMSDCCAVSVRNSNTGLAIASHPIAQKGENTWSRNIKRKISRRNSTVASQQPGVNGTIHHESCHCALTRRFRLDMLGHVMGSLSPINRHILSASHTIGSIYRPAVAELHKEYLELMSLLRTVAETTSTLAEFIIRRASRSVGVSKRALESASQKLKDNMPIVPHPHLDHSSLVKARRQIDHLSEYVEDQATILADYVEEQSTVLHDKSLESLQQAKSGLDKLIREARKAVGDDTPVKEPKHVRKRAASGHPKKQRVKVVDKVREKRARRAGDVPVAQRKLEERSRAGKLWDALHHGALALVI